ncbi:MAG: putative transposase [Archaeoglobaceae archaeon]|nr:putative transposase [Archaeoglobaceae archaeon]
MEAVKSYRIKIEVPEDLIEAYFEIKKKTLDFIFSHVKISKKAHLKLSKEDRKKLRDELLKDWKFSKHYVDSAINSVIGLVKGWITLYNKGKAKEKPEITRKTIYIKNTLFSYKNGILKISIEPNKRYLEIDLRNYNWIPKDFDVLGGLLMTENELIITVKKKIEPKAEKWASFDVNLTNITALIDGEIKRYDLRELYHIHRVYELKRQKIQKLSKKKPKTAKKLMQKYPSREKNRAKDFMQKLTAKIAKELVEKKCGAIFEDLKNIKDRVLDKSKELNRKLSKWNARTFQFMLEYKLLWNSLAVKYADPKNSSKTCPLCSGSLASYEGRFMKCKICGCIMDRDVVAVINLQMWGSGVTLKGDKPAFAGDASQKLRGLTKAYVT